MRPSATVTDNTCSAQIPECSGDALAPHADDVGDLIGLRQGPEAQQPAAELLFRSVIPGAMGPSESPAISCATG
jgi:hypothetical protein